MALNREQVVQAAEKYVSRGKIEAAIREYRKVLAENPGDANTLNRVGDLYARIQRIDEAVDFFTQIAAKYTQEGFFVKAIAIYKKIIKLDPTRLEVYEKLAELYHKQGLVNEARTQYQVLADYYLKHENPTSAIAIYQKMTELEPDNPTYHVKLAELYGQQRLTEKALTEHRVIAELMLAHGHAEEAEQVYERGLDIDPENTAFITDAVLKLREAGHGAAAARLLAVAVERNPQAERLARMVGVEDAPGAPGGGSGAFAAPAYDEAAAGLEGFDELGFGGEGREPEEASRPLQPSQATPERTGGPGLMPPPQEELLAALEEVEAATAMPVAGAAPPAEATLEFDLDLDDVFVLDMEDEDEPASLVKPPPDMLGDEPRRPAWAQQPAAAPAGPAPAVPTSRAASPLEAVGAEAPEPFPSPGEAPPLAGPPGWAEAVEAAAQAVDAPGIADLAPATGGGHAGDAGDAGEMAFADLGELAELPGAAGLLDAPGLGEAPAALPTLDPHEAEIEIELELAPFDLDTYEPASAEPAPDPGIAAVPPVEGRAEPPVAASVPPAAMPALPAMPEMPPESPPATAAPAAEPLRIDPDLLERTAAELHPQPVHREEDLVTEAEVLAKYGLEEKAMERLREALRLNPRHLEAYALLVQLHLDKGRHPRVLAIANQMSQAAARAVHREPWLKLRKRLAAAGYGLDGDRVVSPPQARPADDGVNALLRGLIDVPGARSTARRPAGPPAEASRPPEGAAAVAPSAGIAHLPGGAAPTLPPPSLAATPPAAAGVAAAPAAHPEPFAPAFPAPGFPPSAMAPDVPAPPAISDSPALPVVGLGGPAAPGLGPGVPAAPGLGRAHPPAAPARFNPLEIGEMVDREDLDAGSPVSPGVVPPPPSPPQEPAAPAASSSVGRPSLDDTGMSWLDEVEAGRARQAGGGGGRRGGGLFADEDDFFDLAAELEQELSREDGGTAELLAQPAEQSLEQIVEGFKKGVAENLSPTDYDTHLNLGIAYREMGLLDEAIGEFQLAAKDPRLLVECCAMLGLCFLDKGLPELAIKWYRRGLESPRASEEESLGLMYDMGNVYEAMSDIESAYKTFVEIYGINTNFRDVVARIEELGRAR